MAWRFVFGLYDTSTRAGVGVEDVEGLGVSIRDTIFEPTTANGVVFGVDRTGGLLLTVRLVIRPPANVSTQINDLVSAMNTTATTSCTIELDTYYSRTWTSCRSRGVDLDVSLINRGVVRADVRVLTSGVT